MKIQFPATTVSLTLAGLVFATTGGAATAIFQATGFKICEVDSASAIVWTRLTKDAKQVSVDGPLPTITYGGQPRGEGAANRPDEKPELAFPAKVTVDMLQGASPGAPGQTRVLYRIHGQKGWQQTAWQAVDEDHDFIHQHRLVNLAAGSAYELRVEGRANSAAAVSSTLDGHFRTAPAPDRVSPVKFAVITCQNFYDRDLHTDGWKIYGHITALNPDFFVHTGDILYYDGWAKTLPLARWMWQQMYGLPSAARFHPGVASYFIKDDHDTWMNDCYPGMKTAFMGDFTFAQGQALFRASSGSGTLQRASRRIWTTSCGPTTRSGVDLRNNSGRSAL